jgi:ATP-dependent Clp protease ATP-binding subunit ClpA
VSIEVVAVALVAGLAGGAIGALVMGAIQAWMARPKGTRAQYFGRRSGRAPAMPAAYGGPSGALTGGRMLGPFDRFNEPGKRVLAVAQDEAIRLNHNYIETEHLLAGILRDGDTLAAKALAALGVELSKVRTALEFIIGRGDTPTSPSDITLSPRTKRVIEFSIDEARRMGDQHVGPEHILLGLVREGEGIASGILESLGVSLSKVRQVVFETLQRAPPAHEAEQPPRWRGPFDRMSHRSKRALAMAQDEAIRMGHRSIDPEHLLIGAGRLSELGYVDQEMKRVFDELKLSVEALRIEVAKLNPPGERQPAPGGPTLGADTKKILELALEEGRAKGSLEPEHILLAIGRLPATIAAKVLVSLGATPERVRAVIERPGESAA